MSTLLVDDQLVVAREPALVEGAKPARITSIDAARGFVMLAMIFVNDLAGAPESAHVPTWMQHASDVWDKMKQAGVSPMPRQDWMTFVDMVFPGFLFLVGMAIPFAIGGRLKKGEDVWKILGHVVVRTVSLLALGILMVNIEDDKPNQVAGLSRAGWVGLMFLSGIVAFVEIRPWCVKKGDRVQEDSWKLVTWVVRGIGMAGMLWLAIIYKNVGASEETGEMVTTRILNWHPFSIHTDWYGILGLIGWAYLMGAVVYLVFRNNRLALAMCTVLLMGMWVADKYGSFDHFYLPGVFGPVGVGIGWVGRHVMDYFGYAVGSQSGIVTAGTLLATILVTEDTKEVGRRVKFTLWFMLGTGLAAMVLYEPLLVWKDSATPPWCLWACAITGGVWLVFYVVGDVWKQKWLSKPFAVAGQNVLLAYLLSEGLVGWIDQAGLGNWYGGLAEHGFYSAVGRSFLMGVILLAVTAGVNRVGVRLKL